MKKLEKFLNSINKQDCYEKFIMYYNELVLYNEKVNLTAITDKDEFETKHFLDSLQGYSLINDKVLDIGAGAGFPSLPLAIINENINFTLIESVGKKTDFLKFIADKLELKNAVIIKSRVEDLNKQTKYDFVVARAVSGLNTLLEYSLPFLKIGGKLIAYKGQNYNDEIIAAKNALNILGGQVEKIVDYELEINDEIQNRYLIVVKKIKETAVKFPRGQNKPRLNPL